MGASTYALRLQTCYKIKPYTYENSAQLLFFLKLQEYTVVLKGFCFLE